MPWPEIALFVLKVNPRWITKGYLPCRSFKKKKVSIFMFWFKIRERKSFAKSLDFFFYRCFLKCLSTWFHSFTFIDVFLWINIKTQQLHLWVFPCYFSNTYNIWIYGLMNHFIRVLSGVIFLIKQYLEICMQI